MASDPNNPQTPKPNATGPFDPTAGKDPDALADDALRAAEEALESLGDLKSDMVMPPASYANGQADGATPFALPSFDGARAAVLPAAIDLLSDVNLNVKIELGRTRMLVEDVLKLTEGAVVELDKLAGDPVDVYVNDRHVARGEVLVLNDNFCVRINEIIGPAALRAVSA